MPRTTYHPDSGAFEVFATDEEIRMEGLRSENERLRAELDETKKEVDKILEAIRKGGLKV